MPAFGKPLSLAVLAVLIVTAAPAPLAAAAGPTGWLDPTFGHNGSVAVPEVGHPVDTIGEGRVAVGPTGRVFVLALRYSRSTDQRIELTAFTSAGRLDTTFHGGKPVTVWDSTFDDVECCVIAGPFPTLDGGVQVGFGFFDRGFVDRYAANGSRSWRASTGAGFLGGMTTLAGGSVRTLVTHINQAAPEQPAMTLHGLTPAGAADPAVGPGGNRVLSQKHGGGIVRDATNRLYVVGSQYSAGEDRKVDVRRMSSSGVEDGTYGTAGVTTIEFDPGESLGYGNLALAPDGSLYLTGKRDTDVSILKLTPNGQRDTVAGPGGWIDIPSPHGSSRFGAIAVDGSGRLLVSFVDRNGATLQPSLVRIDPTTGAADPAFGQGGLIPTSSFGTGLATNAGKLVAVSRRTVSGDVQLILARRTN